MSFEAVYPVWRTVRDRFRKTAHGLKEEELDLRLSPDTSTIGYMLRHNADVEYRFAEWFFGRKTPSDIVFAGEGTDGGSGSPESLEELLAFLDASDAHLSEAMRELPEEEWDRSVASPIGASTPREALGRVLYHAGLHAGQIALIRKCAPAAVTAREEAQQG